MHPAQVAASGAAVKQGASRPAKRSSDCAVQHASTAERAVGQRSWRRDQRRPQREPRFALAGAIADVSESQVDLFAGVESQELLHRVVQASAGASDVTSLSAAVRACAVVGGSMATLRSR